MSIENTITDKQEEEIKDVLETINEEISRHDDLEEITDEQLATLPDGLVVEEDQEITLGSRIDSIPEVKTLKESDIPITEVLSGDFNTVDTNTVINASKDELGLTDEEAEKFGEVLIRFKMGEKFNLFKELPAPVQDMIRKLALQAGLPRQEYNFIAANVLNEFMDSKELDNIFVDFDTSLKNAIQMPSTTDMLASSENETTVKKLEMLSESIKEEDPEKAKLLLSIRDEYVLSTTFEKLIEAYNTIGRVRKAVRRDIDKVNRYCEEFNFRNNKSIFKMPDAKVMVMALEKVLVREKSMLVVDTNIDEEKINEIDNTETIDEEKLNADYSNEPIEDIKLNEEIVYELQDITLEDVAKFVILLCKSCENLNPNDPVEASYMYYLCKNIIFLESTDHAKSTFAAQLIINIINVIKLIRSKEDESHHGR